MACRLFGAKPFPEQLLTYCKLDHRNKRQLYLNQITNIYIRKMHFQMSSAKLWPFCFVSDGLMLVFREYSLFPPALHFVPTDNLLVYSCNSSKYITLNELAYCNGTPRFVFQKAGNYRYTFIKCIPKQIQNASLALLARRTGHSLQSIVVIMST